MTHVRNCEGDHPSVALSDGERVLPLLPTILISVLAGIVAGGSALLAGYGILAALSCYVFVGVLVSFLLPMTFHKLITFRADSCPEKSRQPRSEVGLSGVLDQLELLLGDRSIGLGRGSRVMFVAGDTKEARDIRDIFTEEVGFSIRDSQSLEEAMLIILDAPECWDLLCIDLDAFGSVTDVDNIVAEQLFPFREAASRVPVILISRSFSRGALQLLRMS